MKCESVREELYGFLKGWVDDEAGRAIRSHLESCPACAAETQALPQTLAALHEIEEVSPAPRVWEAIEQEIAAPARVAAATPRFRALRTMIGVAAAASVLVAVFSFLILYWSNATIAATVVEFRPVDGATDLRPGQTIGLNQPFTARSYTVLTVPDVGILKLNRDTKIEFVSRRKIRLHSGELFADIEPGGRGFEVEGPDATARVHGTKFGMRTGQTTLLYVIKGRVELTTPAGSVEVTGEQSAVASPKPAIAETTGASRHAEWIAAYESPALWIEAKPGRQTWTVTLSTNSPAPLFLRDLRDAAGHLYAVIQHEKSEPYVVRLEAEALRVDQALPGPNGLLRLDVTHSCMFSATLEPGLFRHGPGRYHVSIGYMSMPDAERRSLWSGRAESLPVEVTR